MTLLFGGSFDPVHRGHLLVSQQAALRLRVARVVLLPCANPPHKSAADLAPARDRVEMCRLAVADAWFAALCGTNLTYEVDDWETRQPGPNYTLRTVQHFRQKLGPHAPLFWLIGLDSLNELHTWHRIDELAESCTLVTVARPGYAWSNESKLSKLISPASLTDIRAHILQIEPVDISATRIRALLRMGKSVDDLVPASVAAYVRDRALYATVSDSADRTSGV